MITLLIILCIIVIVLSLRTRHKQEQIVGLSLEELLSNNLHLQNQCKTNIKEKQVKSSI